jgi:hypothetical protein
MVYANLTESDKLDLQRLLNHRGWKFVLRDAFERISVLESKIFHGELDETAYKSAVSERKSLLRFLQDVYTAAEILPPERINPNA